MACIYFIGRAVCIFCEVNALSLPLMVIWWRLALQQSVLHTVPFHQKSGHFHCCFHSTNHLPTINADKRTREKSSSAVLCGRHQPVEEKSEVCSNKALDVGCLLLILAGDVETNPGPGTYSFILGGAIRISL